MPRPENPLDEANGSLARFAGELRRLRERAGGPSYRVLARRAHYSAATLADAAAGRRLPTLAVTLAYAVTCGGARAEWEQRWRAVAAELTREQPVDDAGVDGPAPYVGLAAFQTDDADRFFGREQLIDEALARLRERRCVAMIGASGCGKSSLLRAGIVPRFTSGPSVVFTPGPRPLEACAAQLALLTGGSAHQVHNDLVDDPRALHRTVLQALADRPAGDELLIVVDQFEEVFTLCHDPTERSRLIAALIEAAQAANSRCRVVLAVRSDFYTHCLLHADLAGILRDGQVAVGPMSADELRRAIILPARRTGCTVESSLLATLVVQAHGRAGVLPLLSHALLETWRRRKGNTLTLAGFDRTGGIDSALAKSAEIVFTSLDEREQEIVQDLFLRLIALGEGTEDTRRRVGQDELDEDTHTVIDKFTNARLVVLADNSMEITHEALINAWPRLRAWLDEDRQALRVHRELTEATAVWQEHRHDPGALLRGVRLAVMKDWAHSHHRANRTEQAFLDASVAADEHEQRLGRRRTRLMRGFVALLAVLLVITTTTAVYATRAQQTATRQRNIAVALNAIRDAENLIGTNPRLAAHLSLVAYRLHPSQATRDSLVATAAAASTIPLGGNAALVSIAPNGRLSAAATRGTDITVLSTISDRATTKLATLSGGLYAARFSPDSQIVATVDQNAMPRLWDVSEPTQPRLLTAIPRKSIDLWFSPNSSLLITQDAIEARPEVLSDGAQTKWRGATGHLWDITDITRPQELVSLPAPTVDRAFFSNGGRRVVTVTVGESHQSKIMAWDIIRPESPQLTGEANALPEKQIVSGVFVENDRTFITGDNAGIITIWDMSTAGAFRKRSTTNGRGELIFEMASSVDNRRLATADISGAVRLWDISMPLTPKKIAEWVRIDSSFGNLMFRPDGRILQATERTSAGKVGLIQWHFDADQSASNVCDRITPDMTEEEWSKHLIEIPYRPSC